MPLTRRWVKIQWQVTARPRCRGPLGLDPPSRAGPKGKCPEFFAHLVWAEQRPALAQAGALTTPTSMALTCAGLEEPSTASTTSSCTTTWSAQTERPPRAACVKTHTFEKCRKYNSPTRHQAASPQYQPFSDAEFPENISTRAADVCVFTRPASGGHSEIRLRVLN